MSPPSLEKCEFMMDGRGKEGVMTFDVTLFQTIGKVKFHRKLQVGRGQWAVYNTIPQRFIITFSYSLAQQVWGLLLNFEWLVH